MQLLLQTLMPQTSSQLLYSTRRLLLNKCKTTQLIYIELFKLIQPCHNRIQTPHHNHVQDNEVGEITMHPQFYTLPNVSHTPQLKQKLLLTRTLDAILIRPPNTSSSATLQRRNHACLRKKRAFLSQSARGIQDMTAARNANEKCRKKRGRSTTRAVKGGLAVIGMSMICAYVSRSWSGKSNSSNYS